KRRVLAWYRLDVKCGALGDIGSARIDDDERHSGFESFTKPLAGIAARDAIMALVGVQPYEQSDIWPIVALNGGHPIAVQRGGDGAPRLVDRVWAEYHW